jgi:hypothetical protein
MVTDLGFRSDPNMHRAITAHQECGYKQGKRWLALARLLESRPEPGQHIYLRIGRRQSKCCDGAKKKVLRMAATSALTFTTFSYKGLLNAASI